MAKISDDQHFPKTKEWLTQKFDGVPRETHRREEEAVHNGAAILEETWRQMEEWEPEDMALFIIELNNRAIKHWDHIKGEAELILGAADEKRNIFYNTLGGNKAGNG